MTDLKELYSFLEVLRKNNNREWFAAHKDEYLRVKAIIESAAVAFRDLIAEVEPAAARLSVADCTYRIYRDTRFSPDKTPYKTHVGIFVNPPFGKKSIRGGYYLHLEPGNSMIYGGTYCLPSPALKAVRKDIYDNIEEYRSIVDSEEFKALFPKVGDEWLKTAPAGYDRNWPYIDYLRPKDFGVGASLKMRTLCSRHGLESLRPYIQQIKRYNDFINYTFDNS